MKLRSIITVLFLTVYMGSTLADDGLGKTHAITITAKEVDLPIDNDGTMYPTWTFGGTVPGPVVRVTEGDTVEFTLVNDETSEHSHSMDFHAARADLLSDFADVRPGSKGSFTFTADYPGVFYYHCGSAPMTEHIARGMFGVIIVDPRDDASWPKADREYVLIQSELYPEPDSEEGYLRNEWSNVMFNGTIFKYDPVHDPNASQWLEAKPGERVRIHFVNAGINEFASFHPIAGIWDRVYPSGNPRNALHGLQSYTVGPGDAATFDLISPKEGANALVNHSMRQAMTGAIAVLMFSDDADPDMGRGENILPR